MTAPAPHALFTPSWHAELQLGYARFGDSTRPTLRRHSGPLRVQKHLYAEGPQVCQHIIVHPPGGIAGGDRLDISAHVGAGAWAQLTSPGAAKWYRASGPAFQQLELSVEAGVMEPTTFTAVKAMESMGLIERRQFGILAIPDGKAITPQNTDQKMVSTFRTEKSTILVW